jgi:alpha-tubulin suppressor-like RCC1 family protein
MAVSLTRYKVGGEDLADIYVDTDTVIDRLDDTIPSSILTEEGIAAVFSKSLWSWGDADGGKLGRNSTLASFSPVQVGNLVDWKSISAGLFSSVAVKTDGTIWSWGPASTGLLGLNSTISRSSPVQIGALTGWKFAEVGRSHCIAVKTNGTLWSWGVGAYGSLGLNSSISRSSPVQIGILADWKFVSAGTGITFGGSGGPHTLAVKTDGTIWSWGNNNQGRLGQNSEISRSSPVQIGILTDWKFVSAGASASFAIKNSGTLWSWGNATGGVLGRNSTAVDTSSPVQIGGLTNWKSVSAGSNDSISANASCGAIKTDGTIWSWGINIEGKLGLNNVTNLSSPVQIGSLTNWKIASFGYRGTNAVKTDGTIWSWGSGTEGLLGLTVTTSRSSPVQIGTLTNWVSVNVGRDHVLARKS